MNHVGEVLLNPSVLGLVGKVVVEVGATRSDRGKAEGVTPRKGARVVLRLGIPRKHGEINVVEGVVSLAVAVLLPVVENVGNETGEFALVGCGGGGGGLGRAGL